MGEVICFLSGKGGTGKSGLCAAVATALAGAGAQTLCIDADVGLRNLDIFLGLSGEEALSFADVCRGDYPLNAAFTHPAYPCLQFLTAPANGSVADIDPAAFEKMLTQAKRDYRFVLLDGPAGLGAGMELVARASDQVILVTLPDPASVRCAERAAQELEKMGCVRTKLVVNRVYNELLKAMGMDIDDMMDSVGLPLLGVVPTDPNVSMAAAVKKPLLRYSRGGASAACKRIAKRLQGQSVPVANR